VLTASGAAVRGSPLSGGYAGAKRMVWLLAGYANGLARELGLGIRFQTVMRSRSSARRSSGARRRTRMRASKASRARRSSPTSAPR
jgi:hypothetical protein